MIEAYPLSWPAGYPQSTSQKKSKFKTTLGAARDYTKDLFFQEHEHLKNNNSWLFTFQVL
jgi:hypothetical protein